VGGGAFEGSDHVEQRLVDGRGDRSLVAGRTRDVDECNGEFDRIQGRVEAGRCSGGHTPTIRCRRCAGPLPCSSVGSGAMSAQGAAATGIATITSDRTVLDVWYPEPSLSAEATSGHRILSGEEIPADLAPLVGDDDARGVETVAVRV